MAASDISGADGHGVFRLPQYIRRIKAGGLNTRPEIKVIRRARATALVDGDNGLGSLVVARAVEEAIALARDNGVGWVGVRHCNHAGAAAVYAAMPLEHDMIGLYFAVGNANHLPPWGIDMLLSTNPIAVAVPALEEPPLVLDMATTVAAYGKVKVAAQQGKTMPEGWMIDRQGRPLTDPGRADDGFLLPIGGYKGAALALMFGLLAGTLNGAANGEDSRRLQQGRCDPDQYRPGDLRRRRQGLRRARRVQAPGRQRDPAIARLGVVAGLRPYPPTRRGPAPPHRGAAGAGHPDPAGIARRARQDGR